MNRKREYTNEERKKILRFIIDNEGFHCLRGNAFWKRMEKQKVVKRTWQSMKEHFRMKIINNLKFYDITKEEEKNIIAGYNTTTATKIEKPEAEAASPSTSINHLDFSDEENPLNVSTSSDNSDDLAADEPSTSTSNKVFKKQSIKRKSDENLNIAEEPVVLIPEEDEESVVIEIDKSPSIPDNNSISSPSLNISSTNLDENFIDFNRKEDENFLQAISKYDSNLMNCSSVITFIKFYADHHSTIKRNWTDIFDRFIEILNNLELYDYLQPRIIRKLSKIKEPLETFRANDFKEPKEEIVRLKLKDGTRKFALNPNPQIQYLNQASLDLVKLLQEYKSKKSDIMEKILTGEMSEETALELLNRLREFKKKYGPPQVPVPVPDEISDKSENDINTTQVVESEYFNNNEINSVKNEDISISENETIVDNESQLSETISIQPEITINFAKNEAVHENETIVDNESEISETINFSESSKCLQPLTTEELHVTNIVGNMIENAEDQSDMEFLSCESRI